MRIEVYVDDDKHPINTIKPPEKFQLDSTKLADGPHQLLFKAIDDKGDFTTKTISFVVQNGPEIIVHGIDDNDTLSGEIDVLANAYGAKIGDEFEPVRMETPRPVPTWAWVLFLVIIGWSAGYISLAMGGKMNNSEFDFVKKLSSEKVVNVSVQDSKNEKTADDNWVALGAQVYGNNCSSCHQSSGAGLPNVFPPLKGNAAVLDSDPKLHIEAVINGLSNKEIDGVLYASPMPAFGSSLTNEEIAAVINHERTSWGNDAPLITAEEVLKFRK